MSVLIDTLKNYTQAKSTPKPPENYAPHPRAPLYGFDDARAEPAP